MTTLAVERTAAPERPRAAIDGYFWRGQLSVRPRKIPADALPGEPGFFQSDSTADDEEGVRSYCKACEIFHHVARRLLQAVLQLFILI